MGEFFIAVDKVKEFDIRTAKFYVGNLLNVLGIGRLIHPNGAEPHFVDDDLAVPAMGEMVETGILAFFDPDDREDLLVLESKGLVSGV